MNEKRLLALALAVLILGCAWQAAFSQTLVSVTPTTVTYDTGVREATISRDILASTPRMGEYQWHADNIAWIQDVAEYQGVEIEVPPLADALLDSLTNALDSLDAAITEASETQARQSALIDSLTARLAASTAERDALAGEMNALEQTNAALTARNAELEASVNEVFGAIYRAITLVKAWSTGR